MRKFYVYILQSQKDKSLYVGYTNNLRRRLREHNKDLFGYTKSRTPWRLIWYCVFSERGTAEEFEKYLKSGSGRVFIKKRILKNNPP